MSIIDANAMPPNGTLAFYIKVDKKKGCNQHLPKIPQRPSYLDDLRDGSPIMMDPNTDFETDCPCNHYNDSKWFHGQCGIDFALSGDGFGMVNDVPFNHSRPLFFVKLNSVYEYEIVKLILIINISIITKCREIFSLVL